MQVTYTQSAVVWMQLCVALSSC